MGSPRILPLFDETAHPPSWNERMTPGEYAVHQSQNSGPPSCTVFSTFAAAESYAIGQITQHPTLRCRIYDHHGFIGKPIAELRGSSYKGDSEISPRFRRWGGSILFFGGLLLIIFDWTHDFRLSWPAMIGIRMFFPGLILLITEAVLIFYAKRKNQPTHHGKTA
jgi:hypothetical protein